MRHVALTSELPLDSQWTQSFIIQGKQFTPSPHAHAAVITNDYFATMSIPVKRGRTFAATDNATAPLVAILDEKAVAAYFGTEDPIGKRIVLTSSPMDKPEWREVVGVVGSVKHMSPLENETKGEMFFPLGTDADKITCTSRSRRRATHRRWRRWYATYFAHSTRVCLSAT